MGPTLNEIRNLCVKNVLKSSRTDVCVFFELKFIVKKADKIVRMILFNNLIRDNQSKDKLIIAN